MTRLLMLTIVGLTGISAIGCNGDGRLLPWRCRGNDDVYAQPYECNHCPCPNYPGMVYEGTPYVSSPTTVPLPPSSSLPAGTVVTPGPVSP